MDFKVLSVLKKFIPTEQYEALKDELVKFEGELNTDITKYVTANTPKMEDLVTEAKKTAHAEIIADLKIDGVTNVEQLNKHIETVKLSSTDATNNLTALQTQFDEVNGKYGAEVELREKLEKETTYTNQMAKIKDLVGDDEKQAKFLHWDLSQQVTDEVSFDDAFTTYEEANPKVPEKRYVDPRFTRQKVKAGKDGEYADAYQRMKKEGIL